MNMQDKGSRKRTDKHDEQNTTGEYHRKVRLINQTGKQNGWSSQESSTKETRTRQQQVKTTGEQQLMKTSDNPTTTWQRGGYKRVWSNYRVIIAEDSQCRRCRSDRERGRDQVSDWQDCGHEWVGVWPGEWEWTGETGTNTETQRKHEETPKHRESGKIQFVIVTDITWLVTVWMIQTNCWRNTLCQHLLFEKQSQLHYVCSWTEYSSTDPINSSSSSIITLWNTKLHSLNKNVF